MTTGDMTMTALTIEQEILIEAPIDTVWRTITEPDQVRQWFADRVELDLRPGGAGTLGFDNDGHPITAPLVVHDVERPHRFSFRWSSPEGIDPVDGNSVLVVFSLVAEADERTRLRVTETGFDAIDWPAEQQASYVADHNEGWAHHLGRLLEQLSASEAPGR
jgi:uncharacterized protein YndB with AHSA1/START domain